MSISFERHVSGEWYNVMLLGEKVGMLVKHPRYNRMKWTVEDNGKNVVSKNFDCFTLRIAMQVARKHFAQKLTESTAPLTRHAVVAVNRAFRESDESHLWPILGRFNATERAIRRLRQQRQHVEFTYVVEYMAALESEISQIVNGTI